MMTFCIKYSNSNDKQSLNQERERERERDRQMRRDLTNEQMEDRKYIYALIYYLCNHILSYTVKF